jgi:hypothetical protein
MMRNILVSATVTAALCSLSISAAPALGFAFESETSSSTETTPSTDLVIQLGTSGSVECSTLKLKSSPAFGSSETLHVQIKEPTGCIFNNNAKQVSETAAIISTGSGKNCPIELESEQLIELSETEFAEGFAEVGCHPQFKTTLNSCTVELEEPTAHIREFEWYDTNDTLHHYESVLKLKLKKVKYTISSGCGSGGINGELHLTAPIKYVVVPPAM